MEKSGFDMRKLSIVGKYYHTEEHVTGYYTVGDRMMAWGKFVLIVHGTPEEITRANSLMEHTDHQGLAEHAA